MTFKELQDEVIATRFDSSQRDRIKHWINLRYTWLWNLDNWNFKRVSLADLVVSGATPTMPTDLAKVIRLYDDQGNELVHRDPNDVEYDLVQPAATTGARAAEFTVIDRQVYLYPTPPSATYKLSYLRRLSHVDASTGVTEGILVEDSDQPIWPAEHDYVLVLEAVILGQQLRNDPTWTELVSQRDELLDGMKRDLVFGVADQVEVWGVC